MGSSRGDSYSPLSFQFHGIHGGPNPVFALDLVDGKNAFGVEEDSFRQRSLT